MAYNRYGVITTLLVDVLLSMLLSVNPNVRQLPTLLDKDIKANCSAVALQFV